MKKLIILFIACLCMLWACDSEDKGYNFDISVVKPAADFTDLRDGHVYSCVQIGKQVWMVENLSYFLPKGTLDGCFTWNGETFDISDVSYPEDEWIDLMKTTMNDPQYDWEAMGVQISLVELYIGFVEDGMMYSSGATNLIKNKAPGFYEIVEDDLAELQLQAVDELALKNFQETEAKNGNYSETYGLLYSYEAAQKAVPEGWRLPTDEDWKKLEETLGMNRQEIDRLNEWRGSGVGTLLKENGAIGFNARMAGGDVYSASDISPDFLRYGESCYFWTSTKTKQNDSIDLAIIRSLAVYSDAVWRGTSRIDNGKRDMHYSVRCVKDIN